MFGYQKDVKLMFWLSGECQVDVQLSGECQVDVWLSEGCEGDVWLSEGCQVDILAPDKLLFVFDLPSHAIVGRGYGSDFRCADWCFVSTSYQQFHYSVPVVMKTVKLLSV